MTQYDTLNVKLSNSQLNKLKSGIKNGSQVTLNISSKIKSFKAFANVSSNSIKFSKTQLSKIVQVGRFIGRLLGTLLKTGLSLIGNVLKALAESVLIPLGLTAAESAA